MKKQIPLVEAVGWIVVSMIICSGTIFMATRKWQKEERQKAQDPSWHLLSIVQTGSNKEPLKSIYLAQLMGLSCDKPTSFHRFDVKKAKKNLLKSPVIKDAHVDLITPSSVYVEYKVREPVDMLYDYANRAIDEEGYLFPLHPFFTPTS